MPEPSQPPPPLEAPRPHQPPRPRSAPAFERWLWASRYLAVVPVVFALLIALFVCGFATMDAIRLVSKVPAIVAMSDADLVQVRLETIAKVVKIIDLYLVATFMVVFSLGLYELFIAKLAVAEDAEVAERLLLIRDLDDLKDRLAKIVLLILALLFLEQALRVPLTQPLDLLYLAIGTLLVAGALHLSRGSKGK